MAILQSGSAFNHIITAATILVVGISLALIIRNRCHKWIKLGVDVSVESFIINAIFTLIITIIVITALAKLGVPTASLLTLLGAASLAISLSLKDFLGNVAAGFIIIFLRPFKTDDFIDVGGNLGTVTNVNLFVTQLKTPTNEAIFIPNSKIIQDRIINKSHYPIRRLDITISVSYGSDLAKAKEVAAQVLKDCSYVLADPLFTIGLDDLADSSVNIVLKVWVERTNYVDAKFAVLEGIKKAYTAHGISIPFPQMDVNLSRSNVHPILVDD